jgi:Fuc2NAc and GlcNAc transferase
MYIEYFLFFIVSLGLTYLVRKLAIKKNIMDNPNERSSHSIPTPRGGGLAIVIVWFFGLIYLFFNNIIEDHLFYSLLSGMLLAVVSFLDDIFDLKPSIRLLTQAITAGAALFFLGGFQQNIFDNQIVFIIINVVVFIGLIWFINLYNFLDGIDGYASQEAILVAIGMFIITGDLIFGLLISSVAGFLIWNWPKAKIFMGDVGSTQLGFAIAILGIYVNNTQELNIFNWLILTSVFWFDASFTLFQRWKGKEKISQAHRKHAYQRLVRGGFSHQKVTILAIFMNIILLSIVILDTIFIEQSIVLLGVVIISNLFIYHRINRFFPFDKS